MKIPNLGEFRVLTLRETNPEGWKWDGSCPEAADSYWRATIASNPAFSGDVETFYVLCVSTRRKIMGHFLVSTGTLDTLLVHPREVFRPAIVASAAAIICMHNHPSGDPTPSEADIKVTRDLVRAGQLLKIELLDHVIVGVPQEGRKGFTSLRECGYWL